MKRDINWEEIQKEYDERDTSSYSWEYSGRRKIIGLISKRAKPKIVEKYPQKTITRKLAIKGVLLISTTFFSETNTAAYHENLRDSAHDVFVCVSHSRENRYEKRRESLEARRIDNILLDMQKKANS